MNDLLKKAKGLINNLTGKKEDVQQNASESQTISVLMQDGTIEEYPEAFRITDGINCAVCLGETYHTHLDCKYLKYERGTGRQVKGMYIKDAEREGIYKCFECKNLDELYGED